MNRATELDRNLVAALYMQRGYAQELPVNTTVRSRPLTGQYHLALVGWRPISAAEDHTRKKVTWIELWRITESASN